MTRTIIAAATSLCLVSLSVRVAADTLMMRDGTRVEGEVVSIKGRTITFKHSDGVPRRYFTSQVEGLTFVSAERANPRAVNGRRLDAPAGTQIVVHTTEAIDSRNSGADQVFSAVVDEPVTDHTGRVIIPGGSSVQLVIRQLSASRTTDRPEMALDIQSIAIDGRPYFVTKGAAIGVLPGSGGAHVLTRGRDVKVPAKTAITFRLDRLVMFQAAP